MGKYLSTYFFGILFLSLVSAGTVAAQSTNVSGKWNMKVELNVGSGTPSFVLKQTGETITGTYTGQLGESAVTGTLKGLEIRLEFKAGEYTIVYTGTVAGDTMIGKVAIGDVAEGTFTGSKQLN